MRDQLSLTRRFWTCLTLAAVIATTAAVELTVDRPSVARSGAFTGGATASAISSGWFCALTPAAASSPRNGTIDIANFNRNPVSAVASIYPTKGPAVEVPLGIPGNSRVSMPVGEHVDSDYAAVMVKVDRGNVSVEHSAKDGRGESWAPCSSTASPQAYFTSGNSLSGGSMSLGLFNPFSEPAIADIELLTNEGRSKPPAFQGTVIGPHSVTVLSLSDAVRRRDWIAGSVIMRRGRVVVDQLQTGIVDGATTGPVVSQTSTDLTTVANLPDVAVIDNVTDHLAIYNPHDEEADVRIDIAGEGDPIEPFRLRVPPDGRVGLNLETQSRIARGAHVSLRVISQNHLPIAVGRTVGAGSGSGLFGGSLQAGSPLESKLWLFAAGNVAGPAEEYISVANFGAVAADVRLDLVGDGTSTTVKQSIRIEPNRRVMVKLDDVTDLDGSVRVEASAPVVASREMRGKSTGGPNPPQWFTSAMGTPIAGEVSVVKR